MNDLEKFIYVSAIALIILSSAVVVLIWLKKDES